MNPTNEILFEVTNGDRKNVVDISARTCTCKRSTQLLLISYIYISNFKILFVN